jgi:hypothetical protein
MTTTTVVLPDERLLRLRKLAARFDVTLEDLVLLSVDELLARPDEAFQQAMRRTLEKNKELYLRLAQCGTCFSTRF